MSDVTTLVVGLGIGFLFGGLLTALWTAGRSRAKTHRAEATADALRQQLDSDRGETERLRRELAHAQQVRAVAETRVEDAHKNLDEQKALLDQARRELLDAFQALSGEALKHNNEAFLKLARVSFETLQAKAEGDLAQRQQAINGLVQPLQDSLKRYDEQLRQLEQSRQAAYGGLDQPLK